MGIIVLVIAFVLVIGIYILVNRSGGFSFPWVQFYVRGKESGFSFSEVNLLRHVAIENKLKTPTSLFWSVKTLDRCIRSAIVGFRSHRTTEQPRNQEFLDKLFTFRRRVEFDQPKYRMGISSTRGISPGQTFKITPAAGGVYIAKLIENNRRYIALTYPRGRSDNPGFSWKDQQIKVYFWRKEDAGYYFESKVIGDYLDRKVPIIHVSHSDNIIRAQKRRSVRREAGVPALLFPLRTINQANETIESSGGYRCKLLDISEDGAAVAIGGRAKAGLPVKIQARLSDEAVVLSGVIKSVDFKQKNNASVLHIQGQPGSVGMRVKILTYVYGLFSDDEHTTRLPDSAKRQTPSRRGDNTNAPGNTTEEPPEASPRQRAAHSARSEDQ
ncbi:MAG: PilZ domain-containing protein [Alkalispirochaeta sp.]